MPRQLATGYLTQAAAQIMLGFAAEETLLYSTELKFYGNRVKMDKDFNRKYFNTNMKGLHCQGKFQRMKQGIDDGIRHGSAGGAEAGRAEGAALIWQMQSWRVEENDAGTDKGIYRGCGISTGGNRRGVFR